MSYSGIIWHKKDYTGTSKCDIISIAAQLRRRERTRHTKAEVKAMKVLTSSQVCGQCIYYADGFCNRFAEAPEPGLECTAMKLREQVDYELHVVTLTKSIFHGQIYVYTHRDPTADQLACAANIVHFLNASGYEFKSVTVNADTESEKYHISIH
jgi:hypothetical protein